MIDDQVGHQSEMCSDIFYVLPGANCSIYLCVFLDGESVIGAPWKKRQNVYAGNRSAQVRIQEAAQCLQWRMGCRRIRVGQHIVGVTDQIRVTLAPVTWSSRRLAGLGWQPHLFQQLACQSLDRRWRQFGVNMRQVIDDTLKQICHLLRNSSVSASTAARICSRMSGTALHTRFQLGMKGVSMGLSRK